MGKYGTGTAKLLCGTERDWEFAGHGKSRSGLTGPHIRVPLDQKWAQKTREI